MIGLRTAGLIFLLLATAAAVTTLTVAPSIYGDDETRDIVITPTITISATGGITTVTEGQDLSFTITAAPPQAAPLEVQVSLFPRGFFTDIPQHNPEIYLPDPDSIKTVTIPARETPSSLEATAVLLIASIDDDHDEEEGWIQAALLTGPGHNLGVPARQTIQVEDNDATLPPSKMNPPTVLPTDGGMEIFWEEPPPPNTVETPTQGREITVYQITGAGPRTINVLGRDQKHHSVTGLVNEQTYNVQIQACRASTYCSTPSDVVAATPTASGPTITSTARSVTLPEETAAQVAEFSAVSTTPGTITWRLGGTGSDNFSQTVSSGTMTLGVNAGVSFESRTFYQLTVVATDSSTERASNSTAVRVNITDVDETPTFAETSIVTPTYVVGEAAELRLPAPEAADEEPVTYATRDLPPGMYMIGPRLIGGIPTQAGTFTATHTATDADGDAGILRVEFKVDPAVNHAPAVATQLGDYYLDLTNGTEEGTEEIALGSAFDDEDEGDTLTYTATSSATSPLGTAVGVSVTGETLTLTPIESGTSTVTVTVSDQGGLTASQTFTTTVDYLPVITITPNQTPRTEDQDVRFTITAQPAPTQAMEVKICVSQGDSVYLTVTTISTTCDPPNSLDATTNRSLSTIGFPRGSTSEELILQITDDDIAEEDGTITASLLRLQGDPYKAGDPAAGMVTIQDNDSITLTVEPHSLRQVRIGWNLLPDAEGYELQIQPAPANWITPPTVSYGSTVDHRLVDLDGVLPNEGMADGDFDFRIRDYRTVGGVRKNGQFSQTIRIVENPLTAPGGRAYVPNNTGRAELSWVAEADATDQEVRYRRLDSYRETIKPGSDPCMDQSQAPPVFHNHDAWPTMPNWPNYEVTAQTKTLTGSAGEIAGLSNCWLYALQLNYEVPDPTGTGRVRVFSANDAYVWPSPTQFPEANQQVATYPFFGHHSARTFNYAICTHTFDHDEWTDVINEAFLNWSAATDGFITIAPYSPRPTGACATGPTDPAEPDYAYYMRDLMMADDQYNEVRMFDLPNESDIYSFPEFKSDVFKLCITKADACVTSFTGYSALDPSDIQRRLDIAERLENPSLVDRARLLKDILDASRGDLEPSETIQSVDVSFKKDSFVEDELDSPVATPFNTCTAKIMGDGHAAYELALHEAGHALGISGFDYLNFAANLGNVSYHVAHPTIPDSVMNYDDEIGQLRERYKPDQPDEPDCSPHPFDVMAIYALYQNVSP